MKHPYRFLFHPPTLIPVSSWKLCLLCRVLLYLKLGSMKGDPSKHVQRPLWVSLGPAGPIDIRGCSEAGVPTQANCLVEQVFNGYLIRRPHYHFHDLEKLPSEASTKKHCRTSALALWGESGLPSAAGLRLCVFVHHSLTWHHCSNCFILLSENASLDLNLQTSAFCWKPFALKGGMDSVQFFWLLCQTDVSHCFL